MNDEDRDQHPNFDELLRRNPDIKAALDALKVTIRIDPENRFKANVTLPFGECPGKSRQTGDPARK